ncbi:MAG: oligosaccharide flippase family protein [Scandinavium sp.]|uniref:oligosaccharide flippase family protein n=1 Tax=Scandinavium sp. TaxID=2830653 RepID=UPI003F2D1208
MFNRFKRNDRKISNFLWIIVEKIIAILGLILVTAYVARYIGPTIYGRIALAVSVFQIVQFIAQMGTDTLIIKRASLRVLSGIRLTKIAITLVGMTYLLLGLPVLGFISVGREPVTVVLFAAVFTSYFFLTVDLFSFFNNALLQSERNTLANLSGLISGLSIRYLIVKLGMPAEWLGIPIILTTLVPLILRCIWFFRSSATTGEATQFNVKKHGTRYAKYIFQTGGALVVSALSVAIYTRINQLLISSLIGDKALGVYSCALAISMTWSFITVALVTTLMPSIYNERDNNRAEDKTARLCRVTILIAMICIVGYIFIGHFIISSLYGEAYIEAYKPGIILCISCLFSGLGTISSRYMIKYTGYRYISIKALITGLTSVLISYVLIQRMGIMGAAINVLITEILSGTVLNYFFMRGAVLRMHFRILPGMRLNTLSS